MQRSRISAGILAVVQAICVIALLAIMLYTVANVVSRVTVGTPLPAVIELITRWWMIPLVFGGWLLAYVVHEHILVDFVVEHTRGVLSSIYHWLNQLLLLLFLGLVVVGGWIGATENRVRGEYGIDTGWPVWVTRYVVPILVAVLIGYVLYGLVRRALGLPPESAAADDVGAAADEAGAATEDVGTADPSGAVAAGRSAQQGGRPAGAEGTVRDGDS